jgi:hypothetical protein
LFFFGFTEKQISFSVLTASKAIQVMPKNPENSVSILKARIIDSNVNAKSGGQILRNPRNVCVCQCYCKRNAHIFLLAFQQEFH